MLKFINQLFYRNKIRTLPIEERRRYDPDAKETFSLIDPPPGVRYTEEEPAGAAPSTTMEIVLPIRNGLMGAFLTLLGGVLTVMGTAVSSAPAYHIITLVPAGLFFLRATYFFFGRYRIRVQGNEMKIHEGLLRQLFPRRIRLNRIRRIAYREIPDKAFSLKSFSPMSYDSSGYPLSRDRTLILEDDHNIHYVSRLRYPQIAFLRQVLEEQIRHAYKTYPGSWKGHPPSDPNALGEGKR